MSYLVEINKSDVQKMALTIATIPCLLFAAGFLTATLSQSSPSTSPVPAIPYNDAVIPHPNTAPEVSVVSEIVEPETVLEPIAANTELTEPATITEPVAATTEKTESATTTDPVATITQAGTTDETTESTTATEVTEPIAAVAETVEPAIALPETAEPIVATENDVSTQELSEAKEIPAPALASEETPVQPVESDQAPLTSQLFSVQVAAFRDASNALDYAVQLKAKGYPVEVTVENSAADNSIYKVLYGSFEREQALKSAADFSQREKTTSFIIARS